MVDDSPQTGSHDGSQQLETAPENRRPSGERRSTKFRPGVSGNPAGRPRAEREVRELARKYTKKAVRRLAELMRADNPRVAVAACTALLDRGWGRPFQAITGPAGAPLFSANAGAVVGALAATDAYLRLMNGESLELPAFHSAPVAEQPAQLEANHD